MGWYGEFPPYVSVAERRKKAASKITALKKKGQIVSPVVLESRVIAKTFWGKAWCDNLESYSDYANRLPRGRTYVRNGSVIDLQINGGAIEALVSGSSIYQVKISISALSTKNWKTITKECSGKIDSLIELLQGKFSKAVMEIMTRQKTGLFPHPKEIKLSCSCPDWADMCKHVAAVLYSIGARLDECPEALFLLRQVDQADLITQASKTSLATATQETAPVLADSDLSALFGIDIALSTERGANKKILKKKSVKRKRD